MANDYPFQVVVSWRGRVVMKLAELVVRVGLVEPTNERVNDFANWLFEKRLVWIEML